MSNLETNIRQLIEAGLADHEKVLHAMRAFHVATIEKMADIVVSTLSGGRRIYLCGNGGSASDAQHIAAELIGRFKCERRAGYIGIRIGRNARVANKVVQDTCLVLDDCGANVHHRSICRRVFQVT